MKCICPIGKKECKGLRTMSIKEKEVLKERDEILKSSNKEVNDDEGKES